MAKIKKRAVAADIWLDRATAAQVEKMRQELAGRDAQALKRALGLPPDTPGEERKATEASGPVIEVHDLALPEGKRDVLWPAFDFTVPDVAYVLERVKPTVDGGVPSYRLLKLKVQRGAVVALEAGLENMREVALRDIEDHILRDA